MKLLHKKYLKYLQNCRVNDDVYVIAVFSIDPNEVTHAKGRYIATGGNLLISRARDEILGDMKIRLDFDQDFYILKFDLNTPPAINSNSSVKECLKNS